MYRDIFPHRVLVTLSIVAASAALPMFANAANAATPTTVASKTPTTAATIAPKTTIHAATATTGASAGGTAKAPIEGNFCKKKANGSKAVSAKGVALTCKADAKGKLRWTK